jgi:hypothetical protein
VWRGPRNLRFCRYGAGAVLTASYDGKYFLLPPVGFGDVARVYAEMFRAFSGDPGFGGALKIPESHHGALGAAGFVLREDRDNFDYVYSTEDLAELKGRHFDGKRGLVRKFFDNNDFEFTVYSPEHREACLALSAEWVRRKKAAALPEDAAGFDEEARAIRDYLEHLADLHCCGCVLTVNNKVVAFSFGEQLNTDTFVIHFEKGDTDYTGVYQAVNQIFVKNAVLGRCAFVNREQDLGIEGIRKAKLSYHPVRLVRKFLVPRDGAPAT